MIDLEKVTRFEVIDHRQEALDAAVENGDGRSVSVPWSFGRNVLATYWGDGPAVSVSMDLQDEGRTLKIFLKDRQ